MSSNYELIKKCQPRINLTGCELTFAYCEEQYVYNGHVIETHLCVEFKINGKGKINLQELFSSGAEQLSKLAGRRLYIKQSQQTYSGTRIYLLLSESATASPSTKRRFRKNKLIHCKSKQVDEEIIDSPAQQNTPCQTLAANLNQPECNESDGQAECNADPIESNQTSDSQITVNSYDTNSDSGFSNSHDKPYHGRVIKMKFNGREVNTVHFTKSTSCQTEVTALEDDLKRIEIKPIIPLDKIYGVTSQAMKIRRLSETGVLDNVRKYLGFYKDYDFGYKNETRVSMQLRLRNEGVFESDADLLSVYLEYCSKNGIDEKSALKDLENIGHMLRTERTIYLQKANEATKAYFPSPSEHHRRVIVSHHGYKQPAGRCDPELCILM